MNNITAIVLTFNEELHIRRCLDNLQGLAQDIFLIDSFSTDRTTEIAGEYENVHVLQHKWENNHAKQFNWGLANAPIRTEWILRLDADEYLSAELIEELRAYEPADGVNGICLKRGLVFLGKHLRRGGSYPVTLLRLFRKGHGICEPRLMDEHIELTDGESVTMEHDFYDENLNNLSWWLSKHVGYAVREAAEMLDAELDLTETDHSAHGLTEQALQKRRKKQKYSRLPLFWRSAGYFAYRYFVKLGILDGKEGFIWNFMQGWWYRTFVDAKIFEIKKHCGTDKAKILQYLKEEYKIELPSADKNTTPTANGQGN